MDEKFIRAMFGTAEILGVEISKERVAGYWSILGHFGTPRIVAALTVAAENMARPRFPMPAELISLITGEDEDDELAAATAWVAVIEALGTPAAHRLQENDHRVRSGLTACGGLYILRTGSDGESRTWKQMKFIRAYKGAAREETRSRIGEGMADVGQIAGKLAENMKLVDENDPNGDNSEQERSGGADIR